MTSLRGREGGGCIIGSSANSNFSDQQYIHVHDGWWRYIGRKYKMSCSTPAKASSNNDKLHNNPEITSQAASSDKSKGRYAGYRCLYSTCTYNTQPMITSRSEDDTWLCEEYIWHVVKYLMALERDTPNLSAPHRGCNA